MTLLVQLFVLAMVVLYLGLLHAASMSSRSEVAAADRLKLASTAMEAMLICFLARILVDWTPLTAWLWVVGIAALGSGVALAVRRAPALPWLAGGRARRITAPAYCLVLLVLVVLTYATLL